MATTKKSPSALGKLSRRKGQVFERAVARDLRTVYGDAVKRGWQAREGHDAPDVENAPFWVECKHEQHVSIQAALRQAREAATTAGSTLPVLVVAKDTGGKPLAILDWTVFVQLLTALEASKKTSTRVVPVPQYVFRPTQPQGHPAD